MSKKVISKVVNNVVGKSNLGLNAMKRNMTKSVKSMARKSGSISNY